MWRDFEEAISKWKVKENKPEPQQESPSSGRERKSEEHEKRKSSEPKLSESADPPLCKSSDPEDIDSPRPVPVLPLSDQEKFSTKSADPRLKKSSDPRLFKSSDPRLSKSSDQRLSRSSDPRQSKSLDPRLHKEGELKKIEVPVQEDNQYTISKPSGAFAYANSSEKNVDQCVPEETSEETEDVLSKVDAEELDTIAQFLENSS